MQLTGPQSEIRRESQHLTSMLASEQQRILRKPNIIANANTNIAVFSLENSKLSVTRLNVLALLEDDPAWNVDIKEMQFPMLCGEITSSVKA